MLLHETKDFRDLLAVVGRERAIDPGLVEKDYWIMHGLWGLQQIGIRYELKGGTSLSKGFGLIDRFSEDIDILIHPDGCLPTGKNHNKPAHVNARRAFYDGLPAKLSLPGFSGAERDTNFDDERLRSAGIRLHYPTIHPLPEGAKEGILLEAGFDKVAPNRPCLITSWAYEKAASLGLRGLVDNRAANVPCYEAGYTLVEKLQTISTKYRRFVESGEKPQNFLRHYYDVYCLLRNIEVRQFIGTSDYIAHKNNRFPSADNKEISENPAFQLSDGVILQKLEQAYALTSAIYYKGQPPFSEIIGVIRQHAADL